MKKMLCAFEREGTPYLAVNRPQVDLTGAVATIKWDGTCCMVLDGVLYRRLAVKPGKKDPYGFILKDVRENGKRLGFVMADSSDKWHMDAWSRSSGLENGTYELVGPKVQNNPYNLEQHIFIKHGEHRLFDVPSDFDGLRNYLEWFPEEGIVWWKDCEPIAKLKRRDFGFSWNE